MDKIVTSLDDVSNIQLPAIRKMSLVDMYHDGLRGMVYKSLYDSESSEDIKKEALADFVHDSSLMKTYLNEIDKLDLNTVTKKVITDTRPSLDKYINSADVIIRLSLSGKKLEAIPNLHGFNEEFSHLEEKLGMLGDLIEKDSAKSRENGTLTAEEGKRRSFYAIVISLVLGFLATWIIVSKLMDGITNTVESISGFVHDLQNSSQKMNLVSSRLSSSVETQVSSITESVTAMDQISAMIKNNDESASIASQLSIATKKSATSGKNTVDKMIKEMKEISESFDDIQKSINQNNENINQIINVISQIATKTEVINDIVFQTKLLSFNASVEAARAGESGKGFAVVAEEVGNLAQMSGKASSDIARMLVDSQAQVRSMADKTNKNIEIILEQGRTKVLSGNHVANECLNELNKIFDNINELDESINQISIAIKEQSSGVVEVNNSLKHLDNTTTESSDMSQRSREAAEGLKSQSIKLRASIQDLRKVLGSKKGFQIKEDQSSSSNT